MCWLWAGAKELSNGRKEEGGGKKGRRVVRAELESEGES